MLSPLLILSSLFRFILTFCFYPHFLVYRNVQCLSPCPKLERLIAKSSLGSQGLVAKKEPDPEALLFNPWFLLQRTLYPIGDPRPPISHVQMIYSATSSCWARSCYVSEIVTYRCETWPESFRALRDAKRKANAHPLPPSQWFLVRRMLCTIGDPLFPISTLRMIF